MSNLAKSLLVVVGAVTIAGCNEAEAHKSISGVYQGIAWSEQQIPQQIDVTVSDDANPLLTIWDEREHQSSYLGTNHGSKLEFSAINIECKYKSSDLSCETPMGSVAMTPVNELATPVAEFAGTYQARVDNALYQMQVLSSGEFTIFGESCQTQGQLLELASGAAIALKLNDSQCFEASSVNYATLQIDNDSLFSIDVRTSSDAFAEVWVRAQ